jgi:protein-S-isoprenylcysteine O-methyltransferase Ste14
MAIAALLIYLAWGLLSAVFRVAVQVRRTGDTGIRPGEVSFDSAKVWIALFGLFGLLLGVASAVADLLGLSRVPVLVHPAVQTAGTVLAVLGIAATLGAQLAMGTSWRVGVDEDERTELVTTGPFALCRNPIYLGLLTTVTGVTAMVPNVVSLCGWVIVITAIELQVRVVEEPYLRRVHGDAYLRYAGSVGRFVPGIGRV